MESGFEMGKREPGKPWEVGGCYNSTWRFGGGLGYGTNGSRHVKELAMR